MDDDTGRGECRRIYDGWHELAKSPEVDDCWRYTRKTRTSKTLLLAVLDEVK